MDNTTFESHTRKVANSLIRNAPHCFEIPFAELNELLIELDRREHEREWYSPRNVVQRVIDFMVSHSADELYVQDDSNRPGHAYFDDEFVLEDDMPSLPRGIITNSTPGGGWNPVLRIDRLNAWMKEH
ncbi:hypothetical protein HOT75_gp136 [Gordonia phage Daredevil]|uniref:Uncharacterized protein n=1 Tax=Gordonia phage Daredevil TaxID=2283286 RepID=A0A345MIZ1_9CAUD|nr:hypothetical protein HOT75_gp136 [Gordonia phage Daredevil]AXH70522.1 hypothetical protein SEA_DAREDEVIL_136 [Gordonia phage Daredevil]